MSEQQYLIDYIAGALVPLRDCFPEITIRIDNAFSYGPCITIGCESEKLIVSVKEIISLLEKHSNPLVRGQEDARRLIRLAQHNKEQVDG